ARPHGIERHELIEPQGGVDFTRDGPKTCGERLRSSSEASRDAKRRRLVRRDRMIEPGAAAIASHHAEIPHHTDDLEPCIADSESVFRMRRSSEPRRASTSGRGGICRYRQKNAWRLCR